MTPSWNLRCGRLEVVVGSLRPAWSANHTHGGGNVTGDGHSYGVVLNSDPVATYSQSRVLCAMFYLLSSASVSSLAKG